MVAKKKEESPFKSKDEEIGFHKGALNTLVNERNELIKTPRTFTALGSR